MEAVDVAYHNLVLLPTSFLSIPCQSPPTLFESPPDLILIPNAVVMEECSPQYLWQTDWPCTGVRV